VLLLVCWFCWDEDEGGGLDAAAYDSKGYGEYWVREVKKEEKDEEEGEGEDDVGEGPEDEDEEDEGEEGDEEDEEGGCRGNGDELGGWELAISLSMSSLFCMPTKSSTPRMRPYALSWWMGIALSSRIDLLRTQRSTWHMGHTRALLLFM